MVIEIPLTTLALLTKAAQQYKGIFLAEEPNSKNVATMVRQWLYSVQ
jgi:hypothetical protein